MTISISSSTPARFSGTTSGGSAFTTGTFNTPANCLLLVTVGMSGSSANISLTIANNGAATTWATIGEASSSLTGNNGLAGAYWTYLSAARTGMTITVSGTGVGTSQYTSIKVYDILGAASSLPVGGVHAGSASGSPVTTASITTAAAGSLGFVVCLDDTDSGVTSSTDTTFDAFENAFDVSGGSGFKFLGSAGSSVTFNITGGSGAAWNYVAFEIKAAPSGGGTAPTPAIPTFTNGSTPHAVDLNALGANLTNLYNYTLGGFRTSKPLTVVRVAQPFTASASAYTLVQFDTPVINTDGMWDSFLVNAGLLYLQVRTAGIYRLYMQYSSTPFVSLTAAGETHVCINGVSVPTNAVSGTSMGGRGTNSQATVGLSVGDRIYGIVYNGDTVGRVSSPQYGGSYLVAEWLSP